MSQEFNTTTAVRISRGYCGSYHDLWRDGSGSIMLGCVSTRGPGVAINFAALQEFRRQNGEFVGLKSPDFSVVVPLSKLDGFGPLAGTDYIVVRRSDVGLGTADLTPCPF